MQSQQDNLLDDIIVVKTNQKGQAQQAAFTASHTTETRTNNDGIFFPVDTEATIAREFIQLKLKKESKLPVTLNDIKEETQMQKIIAFFQENPFISLNNFKQAELLLSSYLNDPLAVTEKLEKLQEEFDKATKNNDKFGKIVMGFALRSKGLRIKLTRPKLKGCTQSVAINFKATIDPALVVYTNWDWKNKKTELIRSKSNYKPQQARNSASIDFDAKVWQAFNPTGLQQKNYMKSLDCIERNYLDLPKFVHEVNKKGLTNILGPNLINNVAIKTDNQDTSFLNFTSNAAQKVEAKVTSFASSIIIYS